MPRAKKASKANFLAAEVPSSSTSVGVQDRVSQFVRTVNNQEMVTPTSVPPAIDLTGAPKKPAAPRKKKAAATITSVQAMQSRVANAIQEVAAPVVAPPTPVPSGGSESEGEFSASKNSKGFEIVNPPGFEIRSPPVKRQRTLPSEQQISPAYRISDAINVYVVKKTWDRANRDFIQLERIYTHSMTKKESVFNFSFEIKHLACMISGLQQLQTYYEAEVETTDEETED